MKNLVISLFALFFLVSCTSDDEVLEKQPDTDSLTILSYLVANNNLNDCLSYNVAIMYAGLSSMNKPATLLIYWDGQTSISGKNHLILKYETDGKGNINGKRADINLTENQILKEAQILKEYSSQISTDKNVMSIVLQDMVTFSPTDKIGIIIGSHGSSWLNTISTSHRAIGYDGVYANSISLPDLADALQSIGKKFEFLLFDACFMGTMETCYYLRDVTDYMISSVMEVPAEGFPYDMFMKDLYKGTVDGYKNVCQSFINYYKNVYDKGEGNAWGTVALVDASEVQSLTNQLKEEIISHKETLADYDVTTLQEYGRAGGVHIAYDVEQFVKELNGGVLPQTFGDQLSKTVLYKGCLEETRSYSYEYSYDVDASNFCGLGLYIPISSRDKWNSYLKTIEWYTIAGWNTIPFNWNF